MDSANTQSFWIEVYKYHLEVALFPPQSIQFHNLHQIPEQVMQKNHHNNLILIQESGEDHRYHKVSF